MSHSLEDAQEYARDVRDEVFKLTEGMALPKSGGEYNILHAFVSVAIEHQNAILALTKWRMYGSARALERVLIETVVRAHWVNKFAYLRLKSSRKGRDGTHSEI